MLPIYAKLSSHVLAIQERREREAVNMIGTVLTLARLKVVPTIKNLICRCFFMIVRCDAVENYMFYRDSQLVVVGLYYGEVAKNCMSLLCSLQVQDIIN